MADLLTISVRLEGNINPDLIVSQIKERADNAIGITMALTRNRWIQYANEHLRKTRADYLLGLDPDASLLHPYDNTPDVNGAVVLHGVLPNMLEKGWMAFDEKPFLLRSPKAKISKSGSRVITVPFRHGTPGTFMYGTPMPEDIYARAKRLKPGQSLKVTGAGDYSWTGYQHRGGKIQNRMQRIIDSSRKRPQSFYMTWRNVSDRSDPMSWMNSGFAGIHAAEALMPFARETFLNTLKDVMEFGTVR